MKSNKLLILLSTAFVLLTSCGNPPQDPLLDTDFDGLYNPVDPNPNSNQYSVKFKSTIDGTESKKPIDIEMDYREFIFDNVPTFNSKVAQIGSMLALDTYFMFEKAEFLNDAYHNEDSDVFNLYGQFGFTNAKYVEVKKENYYDTCGLYLGNHKLSYNGKKYQIFVTTFRGYINTNAWTSNFDFGVDDDTYDDIFGEFPEWTNKEHHKGFDVTVNQAYPKIMEYINQYKDNSCEPYFYAFGQSRGGGLTNLLGKAFTDNNPNIKSAFYCFNAPRTIETNDIGKLTSYKNIFDITCKEDFIHELPLKDWGFKSYGLPYEFSSKEHEEYFNSISSIPFCRFSDRVINALLDFFKILSPTRDDFVEFVEPDLDNNLELVKDVLNSQVDDEIDALENFTNDYISKDCVMAEVINKKALTSDIQFYTRPCILVGLLNATLSIIPNMPQEEDIPDLIVDVTTAALPYKDVMPRYIDGIKNIVSIITEEKAGINEMLCSHGPFATVLCSKFAVEKQNNQL